MSEPFIGEIRMVGFNFAPRGWAMCDGQLLPIAQNTALFSLLGTTYGGNGQTTFALPDLRGRAPMHTGQGPGLSARPQGQTGGTTAVALTQAQLPAHQHTLTSGTDAPATSGRPTAGALLARGLGKPGYVPASAGELVALDASSLVPVGGGQSHNNMQPFLVVNFVIALQGIFPSRN